MEWMKAIIGSYTTFNSEKNPYGIVDYKRPWHTNVYNNSMEGSSGIMHNTTMNEKQI